MRNHLSYRVDTAASDAPLETVRSFLRGHNQTANPEFWVARELNEPCPLHVFAFDDDENVIGGLLGWTQFLWLRVDILSVQLEFRGAGIGRVLMERAESEARGRECCHAFVETMDYQAPDFYVKCGYEVAGRLENWDSHGHAKFFLIKHLSNSS